MKMQRWVQSKLYVNIEHTISNFIKDRMTNFGQKYNYIYTFTFIYSSFTEISNTFHVKH